MRQQTDPGTLSRTLRASYVTANRYARAIGRTTWACNSLAIDVKRSPPGTQFVWMVPKFSWCNHITDMLHDVFQEHGIAGWRKQGPNVLRDSEGRRLHLITPCMAHRVLMGREVIPVDDLGEARDALDTEGRWREWIDYRDLIATRTSRTRLSPLSVKSTAEWLATFDQ